MLEFKGGSLSGAHTLALSNTLLIGNYKIIAWCAGTIKNTEINIDGFIEDADITNFRLHTAINLTGYKVINFTQNKSYTTDMVIYSHGIVNRNNICFNGNGCTITATPKATTNEMLGNIMHFDACNNIEIKDFHFADVIDLTTKTARDARHIIAVAGCNNVHIERCTFYNCCSDAISISEGCQNVFVNDISVERYGRNAISIIDGKGIHILESTFKTPVVSSGVSDAHCSIDIEPSSASANKPIQEIEIRGCLFIGNEFDSIGTVNITLSEQALPNVSIDISDNILRYCGFTASASDTYNYNGQIFFRRNKIYNTAFAAITLDTVSVAGLHTIIEDCYIKNYNISLTGIGSEDKVGILITNRTAGIGSAQFDNITFEQDDEYLSKMNRILGDGYYRAQNITFSNFHFGSNITFGQTDSDRIVTGAGGSCENVTKPVLVDTNPEYGHTQTSEKYIIAMNGTVDFYNHIAPNFKKIEFVRNGAEFSMTKLLPASKTIHYQKGSLVYESGDVIHGIKAVLEWVSGNDYLLTIIGGGVTRGGNEILD